MAVPILKTKLKKESSPYKIFLFFLYFTLKVKKVYIASVIPNDF